MKKLGNFGIFFLVGILALGGIVAAGAYFSDTEASEDNTFTAGTLDIEIADNDEGWNNGTPVVASWQSPACWMPGEEFNAIVRIKNTGCSDILYLGTDLKNYQKDGQGDGSSLAQVIEVVKFNKMIPGNGAWYDNLLGAWIGGANTPDTGYASKVKNYDATLTLEELIDSYWGTEPQTTDPGGGWVQDEKGNWVSTCTDYLHGNGYDGATVVGQACIPAGGTYQLELGFKFMETAGNEYQGDTCQFDIHFYATQDTSTLP